MTRPTLVTGAAGFAGSHLLDLLSRDSSTPLVAWSRDPSPPEHRIAGVEWQTVDLLDRGRVRDAIRHLRPARVYHCAGAAHVGQSWGDATRTLSVNVVGTHHLVEALRDDVPDARVLLPSSALIYQASDDAHAEDHPLIPGSPYALSKLAQELVGHGNGDRPIITIARPFNHAGPRQDHAFVAPGFARRIAEIEAGLETAELRVGNLEPRRDLTDVRDVVRAYQLILERGTPGRPYNVCSGRAIAVRDLLDMFLAKARTVIRIVTDPARYRPNDTPVVLGDFGRIHAELGWSPRIPLEQTVDDLLEYWRERIART
jgi:GDP-4-dehydro-6-deoxy-D-mannose reductase